MQGPPGTESITAPGPLRELWPLIFVQDIHRSIAFYRDSLGFAVINKAGPDGAAVWCRLQCGGCSLMLQQAEPEDGPAAGRGHGVIFYFLCDDADKMHAELTGRGLSLDAPRTAYYGMRQLTVPEPDGYHLCFESAVNEDR
jgi:uncharacterized glyoxalase superfamily protein PhnB